MSATTGPTGARDQVARLLTLVPYLHARGSVRLADAAELLEVSPRQLVADLKVLFLCGLPGGYPDDLIDVDLDALVTEKGAVRGDGVIRVSNADYLRRPLRLTPTEASAVIVALRALRAGATGDTVGVVDRALAKLETAAASGPGEVLLDAGTEADADADLARRTEDDLAARLGDAVLRQVQVELDYYVPTRDEMSHRVVDPRGVVEHGGFRYLDAWCHSAEAPRLFRLDRVAAAVVLDVGVTTEPQVARDLAGGLFVGADDTTLVTLRLAPAARWIVEYYPVADVRPVPGGPDGADGTVEVDLHVADIRWMTKLLMRLAPNASVVAPADYAEAFTDAAQAALALYGR